MYAGVPINSRRPYKRLIGQPLPRESFGNPKVNDLDIAHYRERSPECWRFDVAMNDSFLVRMSDALQT